ncbi:MAG: ATP-binding protein [Runella sp.]
MNIRTRLTLQFTLLVSGIFLLSFTAIYYLRLDYVEEDFYDRLEKKANTTANLLLTIEEVDSVLLKKIDNNNQDVFFNENLAIYGAENQEIYTSNDAINYTLTNDFLAEIRRKKKVRFREQNHKIVGVLYEHGSENVISIAGAEDKWGDQSLKSLLNILFWLFFGVIGIVAVAGWYFAGRALSPISRVVQEVKSVFPHRLDQSLTVENPKDEIGQLTSTFNDLLQQVAEAFRLQSLFISNVSHELKNPLMRIGTQIDVTLLKPRSIEEYQQLMLSVREDIRELGQMAETLLELAKVNDEARQVIYAQVRIDEVVWEARTLLMSVNQSYLVTVHFDDSLNNETQLMISGNAQLLKTAFVNLMENGCKFSNDNSMKVTISSNAQELCIHFENSGVSLKPHELKLIFQPFYRSNNTAHIKGYGVGLSLVERIIKLHGGHINVELFEQPQTTLFAVKIPFELQSDT